MRISMAIPILILGATLGGCNTGGPIGVLPRDPVPPPPSVTGTVVRQKAATQATTGSTALQRRTLAVPSRIAPPRPSP